jgi:hypothetical protein
MRKIVIPIAKLLFIALISVGIQHTFFLVRPAHAQTALLEWGTTRLSVPGDPAATGCLEVAGSAVNGVFATSWVPCVQSNMVAFSTTGSCPTGWSEYTTARGRYILALPASGTNVATVGTALTDQENRPAGSHNHNVTDPGHFHTQQAPTTAGGTVQTAVTGGNGVTDQSAFDHTTTNTTGITINAGGGGTSGQTGVTGTNAPYLQLMACKSN